MLTDEELEACEKGHATVEANRLILPGGVSYDLYHSRRLYILGDQLLGLNQEDED